MYDIDHDEAPVHNESIFIRLQNIATKDLATEAIENDLLEAKIKGQNKQTRLLKKSLFYVRRVILNSGTLCTKTKY